MCETPKEKAEKDQPAEEKSYYYDDAHGYEDFDPDAEDAEEESGESA